MRKKIIRIISLKTFVALFCLVIFLNYPLSGQEGYLSLPGGDLQQGRLRVGFKIFYLEDDSRSFPKQSDGLAFGLQNRPIAVSVWYPATPKKTGNLMKFREYLYSFDRAQTPAAKADSERNFGKYTMMQELPEAAITALLDSPTSSVKDAQPSDGAAAAADKKFPVIVLGQGLYYESPVTHTILCEYLASQGFIVATTALAGAHSPFVKLDAVDLEAAVRDLEFVIGRARQFSNADREKLAVIGFDMGGLAASLLAMRNADIDAVVSLDSGIVAEHNLRLVKQMPDYDPVRLRVPLLHFSHPLSEIEARGIREDTSFLDAARYSERLVVRLAQFRHADFTSRSLIETQAAKMQDELSVRRRRGFEQVARYVLAFLNANLKNDRQSAEFLRRGNEDSTYSGVKIEKERKAAAPATISEDVFLNLLYRDGAAKAREFYRREKAKFPGERIFSEAALNQTGYNRLYRGETDEAILIFALNAEAYPDSANAFDSLAGAYMFAGEKEQALKYYKKSLELNPENENAKRRIKQLEQPEQK